MKSMFKNVKEKAVCAIVKAEIKKQELMKRTKDTLSNQEGQGTLDTAVTVLISIVLGALILAGLYLLVKATVLPSITQKIQEMFDYSA